MPRLVQNTSDGHRHRTSHSHKFVPNGPSHSGNSANEPALNPLNPSPSHPIPSAATTLRCLSY